MIFSIDQYLPDRKNEIFSSSKSRKFEKISSSLPETSLNEKRSVKIDGMGKILLKTFRNHEIKFY